MYVYCMKRSARADVNQLIFLPCQKVTAKLAVIFLKNGGPNRDRTDDLTDANRTLSQLSYRPIVMGAMKGGVHR